MEDIKGNRIEQIMFAKGFRTCASLANYMIEKCPEDAVSEDTILNVIKGKNVRKSTLVSMAKALEVSVEMLITESIPLDIFLDSEIQPLIDEFRRDKNIWNSTSYDTDMLFQFAKEEFDISGWFYHQELGEQINSNPTYPIRTLGDVVVYLPLFDFFDCIDVMNRVSGNAEANGRYILSQFRRLYENIPDIPAKRYADYCVISYRLNNKTTWCTEELRLKETLNKYANSMEYKKGIKQYIDIIDRYLDFRRDLSIRKILENKIPEIYG